MGRKETLGAALLIVRALAANPIDDIAALTVLTATSQLEAKAAFFDSQQILLPRPEQVEKKPQNGNGHLASQGEIFPRQARRITNHQVLPNKPLSIPLLR